MLDPGTLAEAERTLTDIYARAAGLIAPRLHGRLATLTAADLARPLISDEEWEWLILGDRSLTDDSDDDAWLAVWPGASDAVGDGVLDGLVAAAVVFGVLAPAAAHTNLMEGQLRSLAGFAPEMRARLDEWTAGRVAAGDPPSSIAGVEAALRTDTQSPLHPARARLAAEVQTLGAVNGAIDTAMLDQPGAQKRWRTMQDDRVREAHALTDQQTVPIDSWFNVVGWPARYPGDLSLPIALWANCRCWTEYLRPSAVEPVEFTAAEFAGLYSTAAVLGVRGRASMNMGQLQVAVLRELGLVAQGRASDPAVYADWNRTSLLAVARGLGIRGRYLMPRSVLLRRISSRTG